MLLLLFIECCERLELLHHIARDIINRAFDKKFIHAAAGQRNCQ